MLRPLSGPRVTRSLGSATRKKTTAAAGEDDGGRSRRSTEESCDLYKITSHNKVIHRLDRQIYSLLQQRLYSTDDQAQYDKVYPDDYYLYHL